MTEEMKKRLEEAAKEACTCKMCPFEGTCEKKCGIYESFLAGTKQGYKEAIEQAKEWLKEQAEMYCCMISGELYFEEDEMLADFEADMDKLWEGK